MKKGALKAAAFCLTAGMTFSGMNSVAFAAGEMTLAGFGAEMPVKTAEETEAETQTISPVGIDAAIAPVQTEAAQTESIQTEAVQSESAGTEAPETEMIPEASALADAASDDAAQGTDASEAPESEAIPEASALADETPEETEAPETEPVVDTSMSGEIAFAQCDDYINIRSSASADSEPVGKIYNNNSVTILSQVGDWYEVESGNAVGYVKADYFATGTAAQEIAEEVAYNVATVYAEALTVRAEPDEASEQIGMVYSTDELEVVEYDGDWMKVALGGDAYGYVNAYYVGYDTYYATGETLEEEQERLDQEWLDYLAQQEAEQAAAEQAYLDALAAQEAAAQQAAWDAEYQAQQAAQDAQYQVQAEAQAAADAQAQADAQYQAYLDAQAAADAATQQADEQAVIDAAAQAQAAYQEFLNAQAAADAQAQAQAEAEYQAQIQADAAAQAAADAAAAAAAAEAMDDYEDTYTEVSYTESTYTESSGSSLGQQVVDYATQFVGNPYVWGGTSLTNGADCSGFTMSVYANFGISLPHNAAAQSGCGTPVSLNDLQPGDLLFYEGHGGIGHVTIYMGNGQVVHASSSTTGIIISDYGYRTPVCARRYL